MQSSFEDAFFNKNNSTMAVAARTLNDITTYHIWKDRCNVRRDIMPSVIIANNTYHIWKDRCNVRRDIMPSVIIANNMGGIYFHHQG
jgi:hypothetical protein